MHGKVSTIFHRGESVFANLPSSFLTARYHSLVIDPGSVPACLKVTAWTTVDGKAGEAGEIDEIMAIAHRTLPICGVQFHPESIMSEYGHSLLANFLGIAHPVAVAHFQTDVAAGGAYVHAR